MHNSSGAQNFEGCSKHAGHLTVNLSEVSYASTRRKKLYKLESYITRLKSTETSRGFLSLKILLQPFLTITMHQ